MAGLRTAEKPSAAVPLKVVIAASAMDSAAFAAHFTRRHKGSLAKQSELPANMDFNTEQAYRAFHTRLHGLRRYKHEHEPDELDIAIDRVIECLFENHNWGWKQLAGVDGLIAVFPDGQIAVKYNNRTRHFDEIDEATDYLLGRLPVQVK